MSTNVRVAGIIFVEDELVTTKMEKEGSAYHVLPGGGVNLDETIYQALVRELDEELNIRVQRFRPVYLRELRMNCKKGIEIYFLIQEYTGDIEKGYDPEDKVSELTEISYTDPERLDSIKFYPRELIGRLAEDREESFKQVIHLGIRDYEM